MLFSGCSSALPSGSMPVSAEVSGPRRTRPLPVRLSSMSMKPRVASLLGSAERFSSSDVSSAQTVPSAPSTRSRQTCTTVPWRTAPTRAESLFGAFMMKPRLITTSNWSTLGASALMAASSDILSISAAGTLTPDFSAMALKAGFRGALASGGGCWAASSTCLRLCTPRARRLRSITFMLRAIPMPSMSSSVSSRRSSIDASPTSSTSINLSACLSRF
mmetsp:Transcript_49291/g.157696  ORF Transcript_49291/g.157696 Transcript_49291/m.157696 type:complete len:218 (-) Transcript_49291:129-782(-)